MADAGPVDARESRARGAPPGAAWVWAGRAASVTVPLCIAVQRAPLSPVAAHDLGTVRAVGHGSTGVLHGLDAALAALFTLVPLGTRASGAAWGSAALAGVAALVMFETARAWGLGATRLGVGLATIVSVAAGCSMPWQVEAAGVGSSVAPALAALVGIWWIGSGLTWVRAPLLVFVTALTASFDWACAAGLVATAAVVVAIRFGAARGEARGERDEKRGVGGERLVVAAVLGLFPVALALATGRLAPERSLTVGSLDGLGFEHGVVVHHPLVHVMRAEWGPVATIAAGVGGLLGVARKETRAAASALLVWAAIGAAAPAMRIPVGPSRYAAVVLVGTGAAFILAGRAFHVVVSWIERAEIPFARASAAMVLVLLLALPAKNVDDALGSPDPLTEMASAVWAESACGPLPPGSVMLVPDARLERRLLAARASSDLRGDLVLVPMFDVRSPRAARMLAREPLLAGLYRDAIVSGAPEELSLSRFAEARPMVFSYEPRYERSLARHLVPTGLFTRFMPEPRGRLERKAGLDDFLPARGEIARTAMSKGRDLEIVEETTALLRARAIAVAAADDKEVVSRALDDLRHFAPEDPLIQVLVRRVLTSRGVIDLKDLPP